MILTHLAYSEHENKDAHWEVEYPVGQTTLLIARNAVGKSRTLNVTQNLAKSISGKNKPVLHGHWKARFQHDGVEWTYELDVTANGIEHEELIGGGIAYLRRSRDGVGTISVNDNGSPSEAGFKVPNDYLVVNAKRDLIQHPYLEPLHEWASRLRYFDFGTEMGKNHLIILGKQGTAFDPTDADNVAAVFKKGVKEFDDFSGTIASSMAEIGYEIEEAGIEPVPALFAQSVGQPHGIFVKEKSLKVRTWQMPDMSRGMFRALSVIVMVEYALRTGGKGAVVIDDVGEGLDVTRAAALIRLLVRQASAMGTQLIMSSNDRNTINSLPLENICGLIRNGSRVRGVSFDTHPELFNELKHSGLANTDLLGADFFHIKW